MMKAWKLMLMVALPMAASVGTLTEDAHAATTTCDSTSGTCSGLIRQIAVHPDAGAGSSQVAAEVRLDADIAPGCTLASGYWEIAPGRDNIIKTLLSAYLAGKPVTLRKVTTGSTCFVQWVSL
jgi:hypothetical protein